MNNDVLSAKRLTFHFRSAVRSIIYARKNDGPKMEPCGFPTEINQSTAHSELLTVFDP